MAVGVLSALLAVAVTVLLGWALRHVLSFWKWYSRTHGHISKFPHRKPHWLLGNLHQMGSPEGYFNFSVDMMLEHGRAYGAWFTFNPVVFVCHSDTVREAIKNTHAKPMTGLHKGYALIEPWIGDGLLISTGQKWERNRKLLTPAFHFDILKPYVKVYQDCANICGNQLKLLSDELNGESIDICKPLGLCTLDIMLSCALSFKSDLQVNGHPYEKGVGRLMELVLLRSMNPLYLPDFIWSHSSYGREFQGLCDYAHKISGDVITARQKSLKNNPESVNKKYLDFLDILLTAKDEHNVGLTFKEIRDEVDTFLFEGHDTTKAALTWCLYCLAKYPEEQQKVFEEVEEIFGDRQQINWDDLQQLQFTSLFVKEVTRMFPPAPQISRKTSKPIIIDGREVPEDTQLEIHLYALHHNPLIWKNPETFDPLRFTTENFADHDPYSYIPFSAGSRNCIGQVFALNEVKTVLCSLVRRFEFGFDAEHDKKIILQPLATLKSKNGVRVKISERQK